MYIEIAQRDHKGKCTVCGCELHQKERFLVISDGKSERKLCLKCSRKRAEEAIRGNYGVAGKGLALKINILINKIKELNKNDNDKE
ncbi:TPA: hypothetical protein I9092_002173 [Clostridium perfringens]|nr:hypothetical protein [Clostridium perfringens]